MISVRLGLASYRPAAFGPSSALSLFRARLTRRSDLGVIAGASPTTPSVGISLGGSAVNVAPGEAMGDVLLAAEDGGRKLMLRLKMGARWCDGDRCRRVCVHEFEVGVVGVVGVVGSAEDWERRLLSSLSSSSECPKEEGAMELPIDIMEP